MYGNNVHKAVIDSGDKESGISIHYVNKNYDEGDLIYQAVCPIYKKDTVETLAERIHELEYKFLPLITEKTILNQSLQ
jgi:phosphoribosylglycinamide formyltransferase-1